MEDFLVRFMNVPIVTFMGCRVPDAFPIKANNFDKSDEDGVAEVCGDLA